MSEQERETELVTGVIGGITQKKADTWTVAVTVEGMQNAKNLWTKDADLVESLSAKLGQAGAFVCDISNWTTNDGRPVRSLWINSMDASTHAERAAEGFVQAVTGSVPAPSKPSSEDGMSKEEWARKDSAIHKMACLKAAADALKHTIPSDPTPEDLKRFAERVKFLSHGWHTSVLAVREDDDRDIPFE